MLIPHHVPTLVAVLVMAAVFQPLPAQQQAAASAGPDTVVYTPTRGTVTFTHAKHAKLSECAACHHASRAERPYTRPRQACRDCHLAQPVAPVTTSLGAAFHNTVDRTGVCYDCHKKEAAAGKTIPTACSDCHKRQGS